MWEKCICIQPSTITYIKMVQSYHLRVDIWDSISHSLALWSRQHDIITCLSEPPPLFSRTDPPVTGASYHCCGTALRTCLLTVILEYLFLRPLFWVRDSKREEVQSSTPHLSYPAKVNVTATTGATTTHPPLSQHRSIIPRVLGC